MIEVRHIHSSEPEGEEIAREALVRELTSGEPTEVRPLTVDFIHPVLLPVIK